MEQADVERIAKVAAQAAVHDTLVALGIDPDKPVEFQRRMAFLENLQNTSTAMIRHAFLAITGMIAAGITWLIWGKIGGNHP